MFTKGKANIGDQIRVTLKNGNTYEMTISQKNDPVSMGLADYRGSQIVAHIRPGGYSINLDSSEITHIENI